MRRSMPGWTASAAPPSHAGQQGWRMLGYLGRVTVETGIEVMASPRNNLRVAAMVHQVEETGISALPIVGLLAFLIGVVLAYQGADQLKRFGAEFFTINLLGVGILREIGVPDHRHHRGRALRLGLHRPDRHHARQ